LWSRVFMNVAYLILFFPLWSIRLS
jgi:hypothetical protein